MAERAAEAELWRVWKQCGQQWAMNTESLASELQTMPLEGGHRRPPAMVVRCARVRKLLSNISSSTDGAVECARTLDRHVLRIAADAECFLALTLLLGALKGSEITRAAASACDEISPYYPWLTTLAALVPSQEGELFRRRLRAEDASQQPESAEPLVLGTEYPWLEQVVGAMHCAERFAETLNHWYDERACTLLQRFRPGRWLAPCSTHPPRRFDKRCRRAPSLYVRHFMSALVWHRLSEIWESHARKLVCDKQSQSSSGSASDSSRSAMAESFTSAMQKASARALKAGTYVIYGCPAGAASDPYRFFFHRYNMLGTESNLQQCTQKLQEQGESVHTDATCQYGHVSKSDVDQLTDEMRDLSLKEITCADGIGPRLARRIGRRLEQTLGRPLQGRIPTLADLRRAWLDCTGEHSTEKELRDKLETEELPAEGNRMNNIIKMMEDEKIITRG